MTRWKMAEPDRCGASYLSFRHFLMWARDDAEASEAVKADVARIIAGLCPAHRRAMRDLAVAVVRDPPTHVCVALGIHG